MDDVTSQPNLDAIKAQLERENEEKIRAGIDAGIEAGLRREREQREQRKKEELELKKKLEQEETIEAQGNTIVVLAKQCQDLAKQCQDFALAIQHLKDGQLSPEALKKIRKQILLLVPSLIAAIEGIIALF